MSATRGPTTRTHSAWRDRISAAGLLNWRTLAWGLPALFALAYLIVVAANFSAIITSINMDSDASDALVLAKLLGQAPAGSHVVLGNRHYYEAFLLLRATAGLPFYRQLWDVAPMVFTLLSVGLLAWSTWQALGRFAALLTASALVCLGAFGRFTLFTFNWHAPAVWHTIVIGAVLVWLAPRAASIAWLPLVGGAVALGLLTALPVADDPVFPFWALIPMALTVLLMAWRSTGRPRATLPAFAFITILVGVLGGALIDHIMRSNGVTSTSFPFTFLTPGSIVNNVELLFEGYMSLGGGYFFGARPVFLGYLIFASGALLLAAVFLGMVEVRRLASIAGPRPEGGERPSPRLAYIGFWAFSLVVQSAMFVGSSVPVDTLSSRYVLAGYVAIIALVPLLAMRSRGWRLAVTVGVCMFAFSSTYQLVRQPFVPGNVFPSPAAGTELLRFARAHDVHYGYAGFWDASDLTWLTNFGIKVYPVQSGCGPAGLCAFPTIQINTWYRPRSGTRSMLIADSALPGVAALDARLGQPLASARIDNLTVAVYPFDIASKL